MTDEKEYKKICVYHNDSDGRMSAAIYKRHLVEIDKVNECKFIEADHSKKKELKEQTTKLILYPSEVKLDIISSPIIQEIVILDFSFDYEFMNYLKDNCKNFVWIDHHKSAKEDCSPLWDSKEVDGIRDIKHSAAQLTWKYYADEKNRHHAVDLVEDYDIWKFEFGDETHHFAEANRFEGVDYFFQILISGKSFLDEEIIAGKLLYTDKKKRVDMKLLDCVKQIEFHGLKTGLVNCSEYFDASLLGNIICEQGYEISLSYWIKEEKIVFSLRSIEENIDVGGIARQHGGGGHAKAAGFVMSLPKGMGFIEELYNE